MADRLTSQQRASVQAAIGIGHELEDFAARHPQWPQADLRQFWIAVKKYMDENPLQPGQYWGVPSEWD